MSKCQHTTSSSRLLGVLLFPSCSVHVVHWNAMHLCFLMSVVQYSMVFLQYNHCLIESKTLANGLRLRSWRHSVNKANETTT